jgi:hypothetical protein
MDFRKILRGVSSTAYNVAGPQQLWSSLQSPYEKGGSMSYRSFRAAYSEEEAKHFGSGPDGPHGGIRAMHRAIKEGRDSFTHNGRTYVLGRPPEQGTAFARYIRKILGGS